MLSLQAYAFSLRGVPFSDRSGPKMFRAASDLIAAFTLDILLSCNVLNDFADLLRLFTRPWS